MAKQPKAPAPAVRIAPDAIIDIPEADITDPEIIAIERAVRALGDTGASVNVYRQGPAGYRDLTFLFSCLPSEWLADGMRRLQSDYGKGIYRIHMQDGEGQMVINKAVPVEALPRKEVTAAAQPATPAADASLAAVLLEMQRTNVAILDAIKAQANPGNALASLKDIAGIVRTLMPGTPTGDGMQSTFSNMRAMLDLVKAMQPEGAARDADGKVDIGGTAITRGIDLLARVFEQAIAQRGAAVDPSQVQVLDAPRRPQPAGNPSDDEGDDAMIQLEMLKLQLRRANGAAKRNASPDEFADEVYALIPDDVLQNMASDPNWFALVCTAVPECKQYADWYAKLRDALVAIAVEEGVLTQSPQPATVTAQQPGAAPGGDTGKPATAEPAKP